MADQGSVDHVLGGAGVGHGFDLVAHLVEGLLDPLGGLDVPLPGLHQLGDVLGLPHSLLQEFGDSGHVDHIINEVRLLLLLFDLSVSSGKLLIVLLNLLLGFVLAMVLSILVSPVGANLIVHDLVVSVESLLLGRSRLGSISSKRR